MASQLGPTGIQGSQGPIGPLGGRGPLGIIGMTGPQGTVGTEGPRGMTGIAGMTGIQLHGNGSLVQCISQRGPTGIQMDTPTVLLTAFNPTLTSSDDSRTISGQYENTGINFYGSPMNINTKTTLTNTITMPAGRYYITAVLPVLPDESVPPFSSIVLRLMQSATPIRSSAPSLRNGVLYLQTYYEPIETVTLQFLLVINYVHTQYFDSEPVNFFKYMNAENPNTSITIVKIW